MITLPLISDCATTECAFNDQGCNAPAVTIGKPNCITFLPLTIRAGSPEVNAEVGVCGNDTCVLNESLICKAEHVTLGSNNGDCLTYQPR